MNHTIIMDIVNQKGGVGKTTLAISLGYYFATKHNFRVLIIDLDPQGHVATGFGRPRSDGLYQWIVEKKTIQTLTKEICPNLHILTNDHTNLFVEEHVNRIPFREYYLNEIVQKINGFDLIIFDSSPSSSILHLLGLVASTHVIIPITMDYLALDGLIHVLKTIQNLTNFPNVVAPTILGCVPVKFERKTRETLVNLAELQKIVSPSLILPYLPQDTRIREASARGMTIWEYAPNSPAVIGNISNSPIKNSIGRTGGLLHIGEQIISLL